MVLSSGVGEVTLKDFKDASLFNATIVTLNSRIPSDILR